jgi:hypothetical protein
MVSDRLIGNEKLFFNFIVSLSINQQDKNFLLSFCQVIPFKDPVEVKLILIRESV